MAWRRSGDKPLSETTMVSLLTHIYESLGLNELMFNYQQVNGHCSASNQFHTYSCWQCTEMGVIKPIFSIRLFFLLSRRIKTLVTYGISHSYLLGVTAASLWWHLANMNVITSNTIFPNGKFNELSLVTPTPGQPCTWPITDQNWIKLGSDRSIFMSYNSHTTEFLGTVYWKPSRFRVPAPELSHGPLPYWL